jgi:hypothetical protein
MTPVVFSGIYHHFRRALSSVLCLYYVTGVHPEVLYIMASGLFSAEYNLVIAKRANLALSSLLFLVSSSRSLNVTSLSLSS